MKKKVCIPIIIINIIFIVAAIWTRECFIDVYQTSFFWCLALYSMISLILILINNRRFPLIIVVNGLVTLLAIAMFFIYMPKYTPQKAINFLSSTEEFKGQTLIINESTPIENNSISAFVKYSYNITSKEDSALKIVFNPVNGNYYSYNNNIADIILPSELISDLDISFEEEYNLIAENDTYGRISVINKYKNLWIKRGNLYSNKIKKLVDKEDEKLLTSSINSWKQHIQDDKAFIMSISDIICEDNFSSDMLQLEKSFYDIRERAMELERLCKLIEND